MELILKVDPVEEPDIARIMGNISEFSGNLWEIKYNLKKRFEWNIEANKFETQYDLLDEIFEELYVITKNIE